MRGPIIIAFIIVVIVLIASIGSFTLFYKNVSSTSMSTTTIATTMNYSTINCGTNQTAKELLLCITNKSNNLKAYQINYSLTSPFMSSWQLGSGMNGTAIDYNMTVSKDRYKWLEKFSQNHNFMLSGYGINNTNFSCELYSSTVPKWYCFFNGFPNFAPSTFITLINPGILENLSNDSISYLGTDTVADRSCNNFKVYLNSSQLNVIAPDEAVINSFIGWVSDGGQIYFKGLLQNQSNLTLYLCIDSQYGYTSSANVTYENGSKSLIAQRVMNFNQTPPEDNAFIPPATYLASNISCTDREFNFHFISLVNSPNTTVYLENFNVTSKVNTTELKAGDNYSISIPASIGLANYSPFDICIANYCSEPGCETPQAKIVINATDSLNPNSLRTWNLFAGYGSSYNSSVIEQTEEQKVQSGNLINFYVQWLSAPDEAMYIKVDGGSFSGKLMLDYELKPGEWTSGYAYIGNYSTSFSGLDENHTLRVVLNSSGISANVMSN